MGALTYYSPLWLGILAVLALNEPLRADFASHAAWVQWTGVAAGAVVFGLMCQVAMIGAQGIAAQVVPVPWGKSIRGRAATLVGWCLLVWFGFTVIMLLLVRERTKGSLLLGENLGGAIALTAILALLALAVGIVAYIWSLPAAVADFGTDRRRG
jgi:hypothetical protein